MSPLTRHLDRLYATATAIEEFLDETAGDLAYIDWDNLNEAAVQARAYANLIHATSPDAFLESEPEYAERLLRDTRQLADGGVQ